MPKNCAAVGCKSRGSKADRKFFRFPMHNNLSQKTLALTTTRQNLWLLALNRANFLPSSYKYATVCDLHFISGKSAKYTDVENADWVPSINLGYKIIEERLNVIEQIKCELIEQVNSNNPPNGAKQTKPIVVGEEIHSASSSPKDRKTQTEFRQCIRSRDDIDISRQHENYGMPCKCSVEHCQNATWNRREESTMTFHLFPKADKLKTIWKTQIQLGNKQTNIDDCGVVCSAHFKTTDFIYTKQKILLRSFAIPTHFPNSRVEVEDEQDVATEDYVFAHTNDDAYEGNHFEIQDFNRHSSLEDSQDGSQFVNQDDPTKCAFTDIEYHHHQNEIEFVDIWQPSSNPNEKIKCGGDGNIHISPYAACQNDAHCQSKIKAQAKEICRLKRLTERQNSKIKSLEAMLEENSRELFMRARISSECRINSNFKELEETLLRIPATTVVKLKK